MTPRDILKTPRKRSGTSTVTWLDTSTPGLMNVATGTTPHIRMGDLLSPSPARTHTPRGSNVEAMERRQLVELNNNRLMARNTKKAREALNYSNKVLNEYIERSRPGTPNEKSVKRMRAFESPF